MSKKTKIKASVNKNLVSFRRFSKTMLRHEVRQIVNDVQHTNSKRYRHFHEVPREYLKNQLDGVLFDLFNKFRLYILDEMLSTGLEESFLRDHSGLLEQISEQVISIISGFSDTIPDNKVNKPEFLSYVISALSEWKNPVYMHISVERDASSN